MAVVKAKVARVLLFVLLFLLNGVDLAVVQESDSHENVNAFTEKKGLKIFHQNVRGLFTNFNLIQNLFSTCKKIDILTVSETHINGFNDNNDLYQIDGYNFIQRNRKQGKGGGVGIYLRDNLKWKRRFDLERDTVESIWIEINITKSKNFLLAVYYRPPNTSKFLPKNFKDTFNETLLSVTEEQREVVLMGDLNVNFLKKSDNNDIKELFSLYGFKQLIKKPTRISKDTKSLIDIIATNNQATITATNVFPMSIADHDMIGCVRKINNGKFTPKVITCRNYSKYNPDEMNRDFENTNWNILYEIQDVNKAVNFFNDQVKTIFDKHAPITVKTVRGKPCQWLTTDLKKQMSDRDRILTKARKSKLDGDWSLYKKLRNTCNDTIKAAKRAYHRNLLNEYAGDAKGFWKCIKSIFPTKNAQSSSGDNNNKSADFVQKCSKYFAIAVSNLKKNAIFLTDFVWKKKTSFPKRTRKKFTFQYISNLFVLKQLKSFKRKKSAGMDGFPPGMLKDCRLNISQPICHILNLSIRTSTVPTLWKIARVVPIHKKGNTTDPANFRPISLLPVLSKILEKAVHSQLIDFLENENLLSDRQFGYRRNRSTNLATTLLLDEIKKQVNEGLLVGSVFIDLSKAFDTLSHATLLNKLQSYGVEGEELNWMKDYLFSRKQYIQIESHISNLEPCYNGVPQGSILGPLLFLIFFNDFQEQLQNTRTIMYADDTVIYCSGKDVSSIEKALTNDLTRISTYFNTNELIINMNVGKTEVMLFGTAKRVATQPCLNVMYNLQTVNNTNSYTYLGHQLDSSLNLNTDFDTTYKRSISRLRLLSKLRSYLNQEAAMKIFISTILPILTYSLAVKLYLTRTQSMKLLSLENRATKIIGKKVKSIENIMKRQTVSFVWKCINNESCSNFNNYFEKINHGNHTRNNGRSLRLPKCKLEYSKRSFYFMGAKYFNDIPILLRNENDYFKFYCLLNKLFVQ